MSLETWLLFVFLALVPAASPGPGIFLSISNVLRYGRRATLISSSGNSVGLVVLGLGVASGLGALMAASSVMFTVLKIIGAGYLVWLGVKSWRDKSDFIEDGMAMAQPSDFSLFRSAFLVSVTNPKAIVVTAAMFPAFMSESGNMLQQAFILSVSYALICLMVHFGIAFAGAPIRRFFSSSNRLKMLRRGLGSVFIGFGISLAASRS